jgi:hypothetical protein
MSLGASGAVFGLFTVAVIKTHPTLHSISQAASASAQPARPSFPRHCSRTESAAAPLRRVCSRIPLDARGRVPARQQGKEGDALGAGDVAAEPALLLVALHDRGRCLRLLRLGAPDQACPRPPAPRPNHARPQYAPHRRTHTTCSSSIAPCARTAAMHA